MIKTTTTIIETPFSKNKVEIKDWLTGAEREYIEEPLMKAVEAKPKMQGKEAGFEMGNFDVGTFFKDSDHREIETFVVSVDGNTENILDTVLSMHEDDTDFVKKYIKSLAKKKETPKEI